MGMKVQWAQFVHRQRWHGRVTSQWQIVARLLHKLEVICLVECIVYIRKLLIKFCLYLTLALNSV